jgi:murein DD-endopeptidase MepM/ murein hydrolase activator NlpD
LARNEAARRRPAATAITAIVVTVVVSLAGVASAATVSGGGAVVAPSSPSIRDLICITSCVGLRQPTVGGLVQVSGANLGRVTKMTFPGRKDRVIAAVTESTASTAAARVPAGAIDGKVRVKDNFGNASGLSAAELDIRPKSELGSAGDLEIAEAETSPRTAYFFGLHYPRLTYVIRSNRRLNDLRIDVVDGGGGIVKSFFRDNVPANATQEIRWNGKASSGKPAGNGSYSFRIRSQSGETARRASRQTNSLNFKLYGYIFPLRAKHYYGDGIGAPRSGHTHEGQDVLSRCGPKLVAARGGRVQYAGYQGAAGNYIVIDGKDTGKDFAYMHLMRPSPLKEGQVVRTGQKIGNVGETGDATACHLHFEIWSAPGWYEGGHFLNPTPSLKKWDRYS